MTKGSDTQLSQIVGREDRIFRRARIITATTADTSKIFATRQWLLLILQLVMHLYSTSARCSRMTNQQPTAVLRMSTPGTTPQLDGLVLPNHLKPCTAAWTRRAVRTHFFAMAMAWAKAAGLVAPLPTWKEMPLMATLCSLAAAYRASQSSSSAPYLLPSWHLH